MGRDEIITRVKSRDFPDGSFVVFGSGPLAAAGIRDTNDIDLVVSPQLYAKLQHQGWRFKSDPFGNPMLFQGEFEVSKGWHFRNYEPRFEELLMSADVIDGVPFVNLREVKKWKGHIRRAKDIEDIHRIDEFLRKSMA